MSFNRYQIPPNFQICKLHIEAALPFYEESNLIDRCPCCDRGVGDLCTPLCMPTQSMIKISQQIPLYFTYIKGVTFFLLVFTVALVIQYFASSNLQKVEFILELPTDEQISVQIGYVETNQWVRFIFFLLFTILVLLVRGYLKKSKYLGQNIANTLSDRSVMLTNVPRQATVRDIRQRFEDYDLQKVVFTYKVKDYHKCLVDIYQIQKQKIIAIKKKQSPLRKEMIQQRLNAKMIQAEEIFKTFRVPQNQLDIVFVTFRSSAKRQVFLAKHSSSLFGRLFYKFCTCCSSTAIKGQHITVRKAPEPEDIDWLNLQYDYWTKKIHRMACYYMCFAILIYGIMFQYEVSIMKSSNFVTSILRTLVVFLGNFFIITLLEYTTNQIEKHELNTNKILSIVRKLTFFIFLNLSMSPLSIYLYFEFSGDANPDPAVSPFDTLSFSVLTICLGNIFKPLSQYLNVQRILKFISFYYQRYKKINCELTQEEAHQLLEPIPFPIASFYSLLISSLFMTAFFISCYQVLIVVEILACIILYWTSKYMLLRVCREPSGMRNYISRLSQRIFTTTVYIYWIGDKVMYYCIMEKQKTVSDYIGDMGAFLIVEIVILVLVFLFSSTVIAKISSKLAAEEDIRSTLLEEGNRNTNRINSYEDVNAIILLQEQYKKILKAT